MYGCESWTIKKAEGWRIDAFELWCWRRRLSVPWTARRSNQPILKEISPDYSLEGLMLKLKLWYFGHLMRRANSLEKIPVLERIEGRRRRGWQKNRWLDVITDSMDVSLSELWETVKDREAWRAAVHGTGKSRTQLTEQPKVKVLVPQLCPTLCDPLSMEFSRQEYWSGLPFASLGDLSDPEIKLGSVALQADSSLSEPPGKPKRTCVVITSTSAGIPGPQTHLGFLSGCQLWEQGSGCNLSTLRLPQSLTRGPAPPL